MNNDLISVIIPVYNAEKYIVEALYSVVNQTYKNLEIIVLNDGSTDNSKDKILSIKDDRIKYIENDTNKGLIYTRNKLLYYASSNFIAFMDADDICDLKRIEKQYIHLQNNPQISVLGCYYTVFPQGLIIKNPINFNDINQYLLFSCLIGNPTVMLNTNNLNKLLSYDDNFSIAEDYNLWTKFAMEGIIIENLPEILLNYRRHINQTSTYKRDELESTANIIKKQYINWYFKEDINDDLFFNDKTLKESLFSFNEIIKLNKVSKRILLDRLKSIINQKSTFSIIEKYHILKISHLYYYDNKSFLRKLWWDLKILKSPKVITHPTYYK